MTNAILAPLVDLLKVLAHPVRLRILAMLREGELCVCQIVAVLGVPTSTASEHLTELRRSGLLTERKAGRWVHYGLAPRAELAGLVEALWPHVEPLEPVARDREAAQAIRAVPLEVTCGAGRICKPRTAKVLRHG